MDEKRLQEIEEQANSVTVFKDAWIGSQAVFELVAEVRTLKRLLTEAHGVVKSESLCSCDDSPSVPCEAARAIL